jgi:hypothetical protein
VPNSGRRVGAIRRIQVPKPANERFFPISRTCILDKPMDEPQHSPDRPVITPEMIEAGVSEYFGWDDADDPSRLVVAVYRSMLAARYPQSLQAP